MSVLSRRSEISGVRKATEQSLLDATVALLDQGYAYAELSIEQIVKGAGVSRPTFYAYFRDKRALILRLGQDVQQELIAGAEPWLTFAQDEVAPALVALLETFKRHASTFRAITEAATYDDEAAAFWRALYDGFLPMVKARILADAPDLDEDDLVARSYALIWMTERNLSEHIARPTAPEAALIRQLAWIWSTTQGTRLT
ncbi:MAG: TetR/AcrR family transcriptional regulator [Solirubrobacteraceae bacterium]